MYASRQQASNTYYLNLSIMVALKYPSEPSGTATVRDHCHSYHFFFFLCTREPEQACTLL